MRKAVLVAVGAVAAAALWWRRNPSACPYSQRFWVEAPHPLITRSRLREALAPRPGERLLEVGPGTGLLRAAGGGVARTGREARGLRPAAGDARPHVAPG